MVVGTTQPPLLRPPLIETPPQPPRRQDACSARSKKPELTQGGFGQRPPVGGDDAHLQELHPHPLGHQRGTRWPRANWSPQRLRGIVRKFSDGEGTPRVLPERVLQSLLGMRILQIDRALTPDTSEATCSLSRRCNLNTTFGSGSEDCSVSSLEAKTRRILSRPRYKWCRAFPNDSPSSRAISFTESPRKKYAVTAARCLSSNCSKPCSMSLVPSPSDRPQASDTSRA